MSRGPGRWQKMILQRLEQEDGFLLLNCLLDHLDRAPTRSELSAVSRAATLLAKGGGCTLGRIWGRDINEHRAALVWVCRVGTTIERQALTRFEFRLGFPEGLHEPRRFRIL
jgi:hypothetical protein